MEHLPPANQEIPHQEIDQFVAGVLPKDSPEFERIVRDLAENPDGQVWSYLEDLDETRAARLEVLWNRMVGSYRSEEQMLKDPDFRLQIDAALAGENGSGLGADNER